MTGKKRTQSIYSRNSLLFFCCCLEELTMTGQHASNYVVDCSNMMDLTMSNTMSINDHRLNIYGVASKRDETALQWNQWRGNSRARGSLTKVLLLQQTGCWELGSLLACSCAERSYYHTKSFLQSRGQRWGCNSLDCVVCEF